MLAFLVLSSSGSSVDVLSLHGRPSGSSSFHLYPSPLFMPSLMTRSREPESTFAVLLHCAPVLSSSTVLLYLPYCYHTIFLCCPYAYPLNHPIVGLFLARAPGRFQMCCCEVPPLLPPLLILNLFGSNPYWCVPACTHCTHCTHCTQCTHCTH
jgi:hypothetical protein